MPEYIQQSGSEVLPDGSEWPFTVEDAREKESQAGNPTIELQLRILNGAGKGHLVYDNLVFTEKAYWKIDQFREATGEQLVPGQRVVFNADDCIDRRGRVVLKIDNYQGHAKNKVDYYVRSGEESSSPTVSATAADGPVGPVKKNELGEPIDIPF